MTQPINIAITGAAGQIAYAFLFRLAAGAVFGPNTPMNFHLLDIAPALPALDGVVKELEDCAFPLLHSVKITDRPDEAFRDVSWAVLIGAAPRAAGMERSDLLAKNAGIFALQGQALNEYASDDVRVFVVGNPCNTNALIAMHHAPHIPKDRFYAMTRLDQNRGITQLAIKAGVSVNQVKNMIVWGNHSSTQYPDFYHATIDGESAVSVIGDESWCRDTFIPLIQKRGAAVIKARGASSAASAANGIIDSLYALYHDMPEPYSVALCSKGQYGIDEGLIFSFPCRTQGGRIQVIEDIQHNAFARSCLTATLNELRHEYQSVKDLKLI